MQSINNFSTIFHNSDGNIPNSRQPEQPVISNQVQTRAKQGRSNITRSGFSQGDLVFRQSELIESPKFLTLN